MCCQNCHDCVANGICEKTAGHMKFEHTSRILAEAFNRESHIMQLTDFISKGGTYYNTRMIKKIKNSRGK